MVFCRLQGICSSWRPLRGKRGKTGRVGLVTTPGRMPRRSVLLVLFWNLFLCQFHLNATLVCRSICKSHPNCLFFSCSNDLERDKECQMCKTPVPEVCEFFSSFCESFFLLRFFLPFANLFFLLVVRNSPARAVNDFIFIIWFNCFAESNRGRQALASRGFVSLWFQRRNERDFYSFCGRIARQIGEEEGSQAQS